MNKKKKAYTRNKAINLYHAYSTIEKNIKFLYLKKKKIRFYYSVTYI